MDDVVGIMKLYGEVVAKLAKAEEQVKTLSADKENLEKQIATLAWKCNAMQTDNANLQQWCTDMRNAVLQFCASHQIQMELPVQPQLNITQNFNDKMVNYGSVSGDLVSPYYEGCGGDVDDDLTITEGKVKRAIETLDAEGTLTEDQQWYAIYKVLTKCVGYPTSKPMFCKNIEALGLKPLNHPCVYDNWRRVGSVIPHLPQNVDLWNNNREEHDELEASLNRVALRLMELLKMPG